MKKFFKISFGLLVLTASIFLILIFAKQSWLILDAVVQGAKTLQPQIYVPLVVTLLTATLGLCATLYSQSRLKRREIDAAFRERKIAIYLDFLEAVEAIHLAQKEELNLPAVDNNDLVIKLVKVRTKATLWGSSGVLKALSEFSKVGEGNPYEMMKVLDKIQREMRKDLGLSTWSLEPDFFTKLFLSNPEDLEQLKNPNS